MGGGRKNSISMLEAIDRIGCMTGKKVARRCRYEEVREVRYVVGRMRRPLLTSSTMLGTGGPRGIDIATHRDYYCGGSYNTDRLSWTLNTFLPSSNPGRV